MGLADPLRYLEKNYANKERIQDFLMTTILESMGITGMNVQYNVSLT